MNSHAVSDIIRKPVCIFILLLLVTSAYTQVRRGVSTPRYVPSAEDTIISLLPMNTFPASAVNLPFEQPGCSFGRIPFMNPKDVRVMIDSAFIKEGLRLAQDTLINEEGLYVVLDGYNAEYRIGYVLIDHRNLAEDAFAEDLYGPEPLSKLSWLESESEMIEKVDKSYTRSYEIYQHDPVRYLRLGFGGDSLLLSEWQTELNAITDINIRIQRFKELSIAKKLEYSLNWWAKSKVIENYTPLLLSIPDHCSSEAEALAKLNRLIKVEWVFSYGNQKIVDLLLTEIMEINALEDSKIWHERTEILLETLSLIPKRYLFHHNSDNAVYLQGLAILQTENWRDRPEMISALEEWIDRHDVRITEIEALQSATNGCDFFIAPISSRDDRNILGIRSDWAYNDEVRAKERAIEAAKLNATTEAERQQIKTEQQVLGAMKTKLMKLRYETEKRFRLKIIETEVREYIRWAKEQQGY